MKTIIVVILFVLSSAPARLFAQNIQDGYIDSLFQFKLNNVEEWGKINKSIKKGNYIKYVTKRNDGKVELYLYAFEPKQNFAIEDFISKIEYDYDSYGIIPSRENSSVLPFNDKYEIIKNIYIEKSKAQAVYFYKTKYSKSDGYTLIGNLFYMLIFNMSKSNIALGTTESEKYLSDFIPYSNINDLKSLLKKDELGNVIKPENRITKTVDKSDIYFNIPERSGKNEDAIAVVIGNRNYNKKDVPAVEFAETDAALVKEYFQNSLGVKEENIIYLKDASKADFIATFGDKDDYKGKLYDYIKQGKSDIIIYYNGHGAPDIETGAGYFVPSDADPNRIKLTGYPLTMFYDNLSKLKYNSLTVVIDACFSGGYDKGMLIQQASPIFLTSESGVPQKANIITSSKGNQISSWYSEKGHSLFTYYFLKGIQTRADNSSNKLTLGDFKKYLEDKVTPTARKLFGREQNPVIKGDDNSVIVEY